MKFALNGALTVGTLDGANVEIMEEVGRENIFIFGLTADEVAALRPGYRPMDYYAGNPVLKQAIDLIRDGFFSPDDPDLFQPLIDLLLNDDRYMVLADFEAYHQAQMQIDALYCDTEEWTKKSILNVARIGKFSSDRTILEYNRDIWHAEPVPIERNHVERTKVGAAAKATPRAQAAQIEMTRSPALLIVHPGRWGISSASSRLIAELRRHFRPVGHPLPGASGRLAAAEGLVEAWFPIEAAWTACAVRGRAGSRRPGAAWLPFPTSWCSPLPRPSPPACRASPAPGSAVSHRRPPAEQRLHVDRPRTDASRVCGLKAGGRMRAERRPRTTLPHPLTSATAARTAVLIHPGAGSPRKRWPLDGFSGRWRRSWRHSGAEPASSCSGRPNRTFWPRPRTTARHRAPADTTAWSC